MLPLPLARLIVVPASVPPRFVVIPFPVMLSAPVPVAGVPLRLARQRPTIQSTGEVACDSAARRTGDAHICHIDRESGRTKPGIDRHRRSDFISDPLFMPKSPSAFENAAPAAGKQTSPGHRIAQYDVAASAGQRDRRAAQCPSRIRRDPRPGDPQRPAGHHSCPSDSPATCHHQASPRAGDRAPVGKRW